MVDRVRFGFETVEVFGPLIELLEDSGYRVRIPVGGAGHSAVSRCASTEAGRQADYGFRVTRRAIQLLNDAPA